MNTKYEHRPGLFGLASIAAGCAAKNDANRSEGNSTATRGEQSNANSQRVKKQSNHSGGRGSGTADS
jgi:hypothetical protein